LKLRARPVRINKKLDQGSIRFFFPFQPLPKSLDKKESS